MWRPITQSKESSLAKTSVFSLMIEPMRPTIRVSTEWGVHFIRAITAGLVKNAFYRLWKKKALINHAIFDFALSKITSLINQRTAWPTI